jgi:hypothetical protein
MASSRTMKILSAGDVSTLLVSGWIDLGRVSKCSIEIRETGTPSGTISLEGTNQPSGQNEGVPDPNITPVTLAAGAITPALPATGGAAVNYIGGLVIPGGQAQCRWVRLRQTAGGAGSASVFVHFSGDGL